MHIRDIIDCVSTGLSEGLLLNTYKEVVVCYWYIDGLFMPIIIGVISNLIFLSASLGLPVEWKGIR
jgi:hypothetical protein